MLDFDKLAERSGRVLQLHDASLIVSFHDGTYLDFLILQLEQSQYNFVLEGVVHQ